MMARAKTLPLERLEDRTAPATFNVPWPDPTDLTLSFAPDGTDAGGQPSALFHTLDARLPTAVWQGAVLRAFQTWAAVADLNVSVVPDGGQPFGTLGLKQGDPRFGDIRVGAFPMADDTLAVADPYDPFIANTSVGDVFLNSNADFGAGGSGGAYDLFSVLLHEAGHVLGIGPSSDPNSPMFEQYHGATGLTPGDVAAVRALYGPKPPGPAAEPDGGAPRYDPAPPPSGAGSNPADPLAGAVLLATTPGYVEHTYYEAVGSISGDVPAHSYHVQSPDLADGLANVMTVVVRPLGGSDIPLTASIFDARGNPVDAVIVPGTNGLETLQVRGVSSAADYYVQVSAADPSAVWGPARYEVDIDFAMDGSHLQTFVNDTLDRGTTADARVLQVEESQAFQFVLSASDWGAAAMAGVRMTVIDATGRDVFALAAPPGASRVGTVFLDVGRYTVEFTRTTGPADTLTPVLFELNGLSQSDSLGPQLRDTTLAPAEASVAAAVPPPSFFWFPAGSAAPSSPSVAPPGSRQDERGRAIGSAEAQALSPTAGAFAMPVAPAQAPPHAGTTGSDGHGTAGLTDVRQLAGSGGGQLPAESPAPVGDSQPAGPPEGGIVVSTPAPARVTTVADVRQADPPELTGGTEAGGSTEGQEVAVAAAVPADSLPVQPAARTAGAHLIGVLGLGVVVLGWLLLPARAVRTLLRVPSRRVVPVRPAAAHREKKPMAVGCGPSRARSGAE
jgi:hypothetical protein